MVEPAAPVAYRVETDRLVIRCWSPGDAAPLRAAIDRSDDHLRPWIPFMRDEPRSLDETAASLRTIRAGFDSDRDYRYAIFDPSERVLIGETGLYLRVGPGAREIGYWIDRDQIGRGYATEAAAAMVRVAFEITRVDRIEIHCAPANAASAAVPKKLGFTHEGTLKRRSENSEGQLEDSMIWTLFASAYPRSPARTVRIAAYDCTGAAIYFKEV